MRTVAFCSACRLSTGQFNWQATDFNDNLVARFTCPAGHLSAIYYPFGRHFLLLDAGLFALNASQFREAVLNFSSASERFAEFFVRVAGVALGADAAKLDEFWKRVSSQSERQTGAFYFAQTVLRRSVIAPSNSLVELRNRTIHQGYLPSREDADRYGRYALTMIQTLDNFLVGSHNDAWCSVSDATGPTPADDERYGGTLVSPSASTDISFDDALDRMKHQMTLLS